MRKAENIHIRKKQLCTLEKSNYAHMKRTAMLQCGTFLHIRTFMAD